MTQGKLGDALLALGERQGDAERLWEAVAACRAALEVITRERSPEEWGILQKKLDHALSTLRQLK